METKNVPVRKNLRIRQGRCHAVRNSCWSVVGVIGEYAEILEDSQEGGRNLESGVFTSAELQRVSRVHQAGHGVNRAQEERTWVLKKQKNKTNFRRTDKLPKQYKVFSCISHPSSLNVNILHNQSTIIYGPNLTHLTQAGLSEWI